MSGFTPIRRGPAQPQARPVEPAQPELGLVVRRPAPAQPEPVVAPVSPRTRRAAQPKPPAPKPPALSPDAEPLPTPGDAAEVVDLWVELMGELDREARSTDLRVSQVRDFMCKLRLTRDELCGYLRWVFRSDDQWPKFMRKPERAYLALDNLLRRAHIAAHLDTAVSWDTVTGQGAHHGAKWAAYYGDRAYF